MALSDKKNELVHNRTGDDKVRLKTNYDQGHINTLADLSDNGSNPEFGALIYQIGLIQEDIDELRRYITAEVGNGAQGPAGAKGDKGDTGNTGATGAAGAAGARGPSGADGADGADGAAGTTDASQLSASTLPTSRPKDRNKLWNNRGIVNVS